MQIDHQDFNSAAPGLSAHYDVKVIRYPEGLSNWHLVNEYLKLRKEVFVDRMDWPLFHADDLEFEQYDSFDTTYVIVTCDEKVVGGARLRRTDQMSGGGKLRYSYMIRDAHLGLLSGLPDDLCDTPPPIDGGVWELTRMVAVGSREITRLLLETANEFLFRQGADSVLFLGSPAFLRMARAQNWPAHRRGPVTGNRDGRFQVIECPVRPTT